jgi:nucleotide-binding universal stress UspA family protein
MAGDELQMISRISLATDFSPEGAQAFRAALALAVAFRSHIDILHVTGRHDGAEWENFPRVRETLEAWGLLPAGSRQEDVLPLLGVAVSKVEIHGRDPASGIADFVHKHAPDLLVAASHGREQNSWWHEGSVAMEAMRLASLPALLFGPMARDMADPRTGALSLVTVLMPVAETPAPRPALGRLHALLDPLQFDLRAIHVAGSAGSTAAVQAQFPEAVEVEGETVHAIVDAARRIRADVILMPTARHKGLLGALRGSTTEKVLRAAPCAILAIPS